MGLPLNIARRYLFARKSHNVINVISAISAAGMAIGTAALVLILSVYNGFDGIIRQNLSDLAPDLLIRPAQGRFFDSADPVFDSVYESECVESISGILQDNVFINYDGRQAVAEAKGVDSAYEQNSCLEGHVTEGTFALHKGEIPLCALGSALAYSLNVHTWFTQPLELYFPEGAPESRPRIRPRP